MRARWWIAAFVAATAGCGSGNGPSPAPVGPASIGDGGAGRSGDTSGGSGNGDVGGTDGGSAAVVDAGAVMAVDGGTIDGSAVTHDGGSVASDLGGATTGGTPSSDAGSAGFTCDLAAPMTLVAGAQSVRSLAVDGDYLYYNSDESDHVVAYRVPKRGGAKTALVTLPPRSGANLAVDDENVYVLDSGYESPGAGGLHIVPKLAGAERFVAAQGVSCAVPHPIRVTAFGGDVYWTQRDSDDLPAGCTTGIQIVRLPHGGDMPVRISGADEDSISGLYVDATHVFWSDAAGTWRSSHTGAGGQEYLDHFEGSVLTSDGNTLYLSFGRNIFAVTAPGSDHSVYEDPTDDVSGLAGDAAHLWIGASHLSRIDLSSGNTTVISDAAAAGPVAVDDHYVYYFDRANEILKACR